MEEYKCVKERPDFTAGKIYREDSCGDHGDVQHGWKLPNVKYLAACTDYFEKVECAAEVEDLEGDGIIPPEDLGIESPQPNEVLVGYNLIYKSSEAVLRKALNFNDYSVSSMFFRREHLDSAYMDQVKVLGVMDWFEPVFRTVSPLPVIEGFTGEVLNSECVKYGNAIILIATLRKSLEIILDSTKFSKAYVIEGIHPSRIQGVYINYLYMDTDSINGILKHIDELDSVE